MAVRRSGQSSAVTRARSTARSFLAARFRPATRRGLTLTVLLAMLTLLLSAFSVVTEDVLDGDELVSADGPIESFLIGRRSASLTVAMRVFTSLGSTPVVVPLLIAVGLVARRWRGSWRPLLFLAATVAGATLTSTVIKIVIARPRPVSGALVRALGYAFPSGHSTTAAATWLAIAVVLGPLITRRALQILVGTVAVVVVVLVGVSRVYLGVHAPTDVLGGWALGALWVAGTLVAGRLLAQQEQAETPA